MTKSSASLHTPSSSGGALCLISSDICIMNDVSKKSLSTDYERLGYRIPFPDVSRAQIS